MIFSKKNKEEVKKVSEIENNLKQTNASSTEKRHIIGVINNANDKIKYATHIKNSFIKSSPSDEELGEVPSKTQTKNGEPIAKCMENLNISDECVKDGTCNWQNYKIICDIEDGMKVQELCEANYRITKIDEMALPLKVSLLKETLEEIKNEGTDEAQENYNTIIKDMGRHMFIEKNGNNLKALSKWDDFSKEEKFQYGLDTLDESLEVMADTNNPIQYSLGGNELLKARDRKLRKLDEEQIKELNRILNEELDKTVDRYKTARNCMLGAMIFGLPRSFSSWHVSINRKQSGS